MSSEDIASADIIQPQVRSGAAASRPAATAVPDATFFYATDTGALSVALGGSWNAITSAGGGAYTGITSVPTNAVLGRATAGTGAAEALTPAGGIVISAGTITGTAPPHSNAAHLGADFHSMLVAGSLIGTEVETDYIAGSGITLVGVNTPGVKNALTVASAVQRIPRTADSAGKQNATLANDDTLLWATPGNSTAIWLAEAFLLVSAANATMDAKFGWSGPTGGTAYWGLASTGQGATVAGFGGMTTATAITPLLAIGGTQAVATANGVVGISLAGIFFDGGSAGSFNLQWAQNTVDANDLKLLKGSCLRVTPLVA